MQTDIIQELSWRGLVHQTTDDKLQPWLNEKMRTVYAGFDPTADSLHVGNLMPLMLLRRFQKAGHKPIVLAGGATGMIGDPSGKSAERNLLTPEQLQKNLDAVMVQLKSILDFDCGENSAILVNNFDWMSGFGYIQFLREVGKHFPVNVMLGKDSVKGRLENEGGLSYTEFSYMLLQAYDFAHLHKTYGCEMQVGGSDQWGNITAGIDLARRMHSAQLYGLTNPLLVNSDGAKMGKTANGAIWLSDDKTSPYAFYQYWMNVSDDDASKCLRFLTELNEDDVQSLDTSRETEAHLRNSQKRLAEEVTRLIHGQEGLDTALRATSIFFGAEVKDLNDAQLSAIFADVPSCEMQAADLNEGVSLVDAFVQAGLSKSKGEARRTIKQGGGYVNNQKVSDEGMLIKNENLASESAVVLRSGKKKYAILRFR